MRALERQYKTAGKTGTDRASGRAVAEPDTKKRLRTVLRRFYPAYQRKAEGAGYRLISPYWASYCWMACTRAAARRLALSGLMPMACWGRTASTGPCWSFS